MQKNQNEFFKLQLSAITGSVLDYLITILGVSVFHIWYIVANVAGNLAGGMLQFILNKKWVFRQSAGHLGWQSGKFMLVYAGNLILSSLSIYLITSMLHLNYLISKTIVSIVLGTTYNYFMQKKFVFVP